MLGERGPRKRVSSIRTLQETIEALPEGHLGRLTLLRLQDRELGALAAAHSRADTAFALWQAFLGRLGTLGRTLAQGKVLGRVALAVSSAVLVVAVGVVLSRGNQLEPEPFSLLATLAGTVAALAGSITASLATRRFRRQVRDIGEHTVADSTSEAQREQLLLLYLLAQARKHDRDTHDLD